VLDESWAPSTPLKNANLVGSRTVVSVSDASCSMTTWVWPMMLPSPPTCCGAAKYDACAFTKLPSAMFLTPMLIVKAVFDWIVPKLVGKMNLVDGMFVFAAISPIGAGLHEPPLICWPFVSVLPLQKLMKLFVDVSEDT
jgi:hypothetical protein